MISGVSRIDAWSGKARMVTAAQDLEDRKGWKLYVFDMLNCREPEVMATHMALLSEAMEARRPFTLIRTLEENAAAEALAAAWNPPGHYHGD